MLPDHKSKIAATIGPAPDSPEMLERLIRAGLNVARLDFSHGDFTSHADRIARIRAVSSSVSPLRQLIDGQSFIEGSVLT